MQIFSFIPTVIQEKHKTLFMDVQQFNHQWEKRDVSFYATQIVLYVEKLDIKSLVLLYSFCWAEYNQWNIIDT